jgi:beta-phosphoglucomutase-like phosphatase (HAD superfamily)
MRSISFDMDGVLIHSEPLVRLAYLRVGVTLDDELWRQVWGLSWTEWLPALLGGNFEARRIHEAKNRAYARILRDAEILGTTAVRYFRELCEEGAAPYVVTCASEVAATLVLQRLGLTPMQVHAGISVQEKITTINAHNLIHIDDDLTVIQSIRDGVHYTDQSVDELRQTVKELNPWTP